MPLIIAIRSRTQANVVRRPQSTVAVAECRARSC